MRTTCQALLALLALSLTAVASPPLLEGRWAMVQVYPQTALLPIAGEVSRSSMVTQIVEVTQSGSILAMVDTYCFTIVDDGTLLVETAIPDAFMQSLVPAARSAVVTEDAGVLRFEADEYVEVRGAVLDDPVHDALPVTADDPRVVDQDRDGHPGMTVRVKVLGLIEGETYIVQRVRYRLSGVVKSADRIEGTIEWSDEQVVLGATNPLLKADTVGLPNPDPDASRFVMIRVDETWPCEAIRDGLDRILSETDAP